MECSEKKRYLLSLIIFMICCFLFSGSSMTAKAVTEDAFSCVLLSRYEEVIDIGDEFYLLAWTSNGKMPTWKSSNSRVASVNSYGLVTGKKAGTAKITAKISGAEMSCEVKVNKTRIVLNKTSLSLERNASAKLSALVSNHSEVTWKSSKKSIALVDETGLVLAMKPGEAVITASADGTQVNCRVTVRQPKVTLDKTEVKLYRGQSVKLNAEVSSGVAPVWRTNKKSVAFVDENGLVTAVKHGTAVITAKVDGISRICQIMVEQPEIVLNRTEIILKTGETAKLTAEVSSGNPVIWSASRKNIISLAADGTVTALAKGTCYVYASEDGVKERCVIRVLEENG